MDGCGKACGTNDTSPKNQSGQKRQYPIQKVARVPC